MYAKMPFAKSNVFSDYTGTIVALHYYLFRMGVLININLLLSRRDKLVNNFICYYMYNNIPYYNCTTIFIQIIHYYF